MNKTYIMVIGFALILSCLWIPYVVSPWIGVASLVAGFAVLVYATQL